MSYNIFSNYLRIFIRMRFIYLVLFISLSVFAFPSKFLTPDEAFKPDVKLNEKMQIEASIEIAQDMYLYLDALKFEVISKNGISLKSVTKPKGVEHHGDMVYLKSPSFLVELKNSGTQGIKNIEFKLSYQGCSNRGLCYEPMTKTYSFNIDTSKLNEIPKVQNEELSQTDAIADTIKNGNIVVILLTFLGFGLLLALTPCVFPMIPIISGVIVSQGKGITTKKAFMLSVVYVLAMAVAYTIAGVLAGLFGANLQAALQTPWVIYSFSAVFVALAMSMFGFYELKLPDALVSKVSTTGSKTGYVGVAVMGFLSALIVGPCVAAPLAGALVYIGQTGDALLGGMALFSMSIGMGLPLIAVGVSAGKFMPKPGAWMTMVSVVFGVMMLGVAVWMLERVVDGYVTMLLYGTLGIGFSIYLGVFEKGMHTFKKSVAVMMFIYSLALFLGALGGADSMLKPLEFLKPQSVSASTKNIDADEVKFSVVKSIKELDALLAKNKGKKILLDFSASWCTSCKELDEITFKDKRVKAKMKEFVLIRADLSDNSDENKKLSQKYGVFGPPVIMFFDENLKVLSSKTIVGFVGVDEFLKFL